MAMMNSGAKNAMYFYCKKNETVSSAEKVKHCIFFVWPQPE
jgi:hypothetical protein